MSNPFVQSFHLQYSSWYAATPDSLNVAADLALSTFSLCGSEFAVSPECLEMRREANISPFSEAAKALKALLTKNPRHFVSAQAISALGAGWEVSYAASNRNGVLTVEDRRCLCEGICHVLACWPEIQRPKSLLALAMPSLNCLETMLKLAGDTKQSGGLLEAVLVRLASEVIMVGTIIASFSKAVATESGSDRVTIQDAALIIVKRVLPSLVLTAKEFVAKQVCIQVTRSLSTRSLLSPTNTRLIWTFFCFDDFFPTKSIADALGDFLGCCFPGSGLDEQSMNMLDELYHLTTMTKEEGMLLCGESTEEL